VLPKKLLLESHVVHLDRLLTQLTHILLLLVRMMMLLMGPMLPVCFSLSSWLPPHRSLGLALLVHPMLWMMNGRCFVQADQCLLLELPLAHFLLLLLGRILRGTVTIHLNVSLLVLALLMKIRLLWLLLAMLHVTKPPLSRALQEERCGRAGAKRARSRCEWVNGG
jgi:hypothetical protein